jgi:ornithine cyclodeaminase/alanine dehydrogenase-like protein (mu-crystallin family)
MTLLLTERDVQSLLTMELALEAVEAAFRALGEGSAMNHPRRRIPIKHGLLHYMASALPSHNAFGLKIYPATSKGITFLILLYDYDTGRLLALIEGDYLGRLRTGAASGVATKYMARADSKTLAIIGAGGQARTQMQAVCAVRPIEQVRIYSRNAEKRAEFVREAQGSVNAEIIAVEHPRAAVEGADVVVTITTSSTPVFDGRWLGPGTHINAAGSNHLKRREIDGETVRRAAHVAVDSLEQARLECGDLAPAVEEGLITWEAVKELADIVTQKTPGRTSAEDITLFESHGLSVWDIAAAARVYELAVQRGLGQKLPLFQSSVMNHD